MPEWSDRQCDLAKAALRAISHSLSDAGTRVASVPRMMACTTLPLRETDAMEILYASMGTAEAESADYYAL